ncbi:MAG: hypothetical protein GQ532_03625 [Methylomarinum sp.]|nr:hypothetical protein [Methylomarinum sp.]
MKQIKYLLENLSVGERVQLITNAGQTFYSGYIGYISEKSILIKVPKSLKASKGLCLKIRVLLHGNIYSFQSKVLCLNSVPIVYMHLSYPIDIEVSILREQLRVSMSMEVKVEAKKELSNGSRTANAILTDFSAGGASLEAPVQFGTTGDKITVTGKFKTNENEKTITIPCSICQVRGEEDIKTKDVNLQHGVKFEFVNKEDENFVKNLIAQQIVYAKTRKIL